VAVNTNIQDGAMSFAPRSGDVNYEPSESFQLDGSPGLKASPTLPNVHKAAEKEENFYQAGEFYRKLDVAARGRLVKNFAGDLAAVKDAAVRAKIVGFLRAAEKEYGDKVAQLVGVP
jgi:catalase